MRCDSFPNRMCFPRRSCFKPRLGVVTSAWAHTGVVRKTACISDRNDSAFLYGLKSPPAKISVSGIGTFARVLVNILGIGTAENFIDLPFEPIHLVYAQIAPQKVSVSGIGAS